MAYDTQTQPKYSHEGFQSITASVYLPPIQPKSVNEPQRQPSNGTPKQRRRKTIRACNHCQKSHLTCDDSRPCARCIKKGTGSTCVDGARKKAKYLLEAEELLESSGEKQPKVKKPRRIASKGGGSTNGTKTIEKSPDNRSHGRCFINFPLDNVAVTFCCCCFLHRNQQPTCQLVICGAGEKTLYN